MLIFFCSFQRAYILPSQPFMVIREDPIFQGIFKTWNLWTERMKSSFHLFIFFSDYHFVFIPCTVIMMPSSKAGQHKWIQLATKLPEQSPVFFLCMHSTGPQTQRKHAVQNGLFFFFPLMLPSIKFGSVTADREKWQVFFGSVNKHTGRGDIDSINISHTHLHAHSKTHTQL